MEDISIIIRIADKEYPMTINPSEEEKIRKAGKMLNQKILEYRDKFGLEDKQDLLAIVAFDNFVEKINNDQFLNSLDESITSKISLLESLEA